MWWLILFTIVHIYMVIREDMMAGETIISTMLNGWRVAKK
jgi:Ni/Fe-hydrogenase 1 B-type cytochrome subunit